MVNRPKTKITKTAKKEGNAGKQCEEFSPRTIMGDAGSSAYSPAEMEHVS